jgi:hypothetical protein
MSGLLFQGVEGIADTTNLGAPGPSHLGTWETMNLVARKRRLPHRRWRVPVDDQDVVPWSDRLTGGM